MGRRNRLRVARIMAGEEVAISARNRDRIKGAGVSFLQKQSTSKQVRFLSESLDSGSLTLASLKKAVGDNTPDQMKKGAEKLAKKKKAVTVDALMKEIREEKGFLELMARVGLDEQWFVSRAEAECNMWSEGEDGKQERRN